MGPHVCGTFLWTEKPGVGMRERIGSSALLTISRLLKLVLLTSMLAFGSDTGSGKPTTIVAPGGLIDVFAVREEIAVAHADLIGGVSAASTSVPTYFCRYPVPPLPLPLTPTNAPAFPNPKPFGSP